MLKRIALLFLALLLMLPCALAEEAPEAAPAENPFVGAWEVLYYIRDGELLTGEAAAENPVMFVFTEDTLAYHFGDGLITESFYSADGNTCYINSEIYTLEHEDLIIGYATPSNMSLSFLLTRIDPIMLNNPFIGTWEVLLTIQPDGSLEDMSDYGQTAAITFEKDALLIIDGEDVHRISCTYADGQCIGTLAEDGMTADLVSSITGDGLLEMRITSQDMPGEAMIICAPENEEVPEEVSKFFGAWREIAVVYNGKLSTETLHPSTPEDSTLLLTYIFGRAAVHQILSDELGDSSFGIMCTYADGACTILYDDVPALCTIDENGLMCIRAEDGSWSSWLVRVEEEAPAAE